MDEDRTANRIKAAAEGSQATTRRVSRMEAMLAQVRRTSAFRALVPAEAGIGWPIPLRRHGQVYVLLPLFGQRVTARRGAPVELYPPFATLTLRWSNAKPVEYVDLRFSRPWPEEQARGPVGTFPHDAVRGPVSDYRRERSRALAMYDELLEHLARDEPVPGEFLDEFAALLRKLMEPGLEPYYRILGPKFFDGIVSRASEGSGRPARITGDRGR